MASAVADVAGWRIGLLAVGLLSLACTAAFRLLLPPPVAPAAPPVRLRALGGQVVRHLRDPGLACLFGLAFVLMGAFVTVYNYLGFRLLVAPFDLPPALVALIFLGYLAGSWASTTAGRLGDRFGRRTVLWIGLVVALAGIAVTAPAWLPTVLVGLVLLTVGFFAAHSLASGWVGRRSAAARRDRPPWRRRSTCSATTRAAASAGRSAAWRSTTWAGSASSGTSACCSWRRCSWRWGCVGCQPPPDQSKATTPRRFLPACMSAKPCAMSSIR